MDTGQEGQRRRSKWIWGCTGGCLGVMVVVGLVVVLGARALMRPVAIVPPETFITAETDAFFAATLDPADPLMVEILARVALLPEFRENVPTRHSGPLQMDPEDAREMLRQVAPFQMVVTLEAGEPGEDPHWAAAFALHKFSRIIGMAVRSAMDDNVRGGLEDHDGTLVGVTPEGTALAIRENNYMVADREEALIHWAERLEQARRSGREAGGEHAAELDPAASEQLKAAYARLSVGWPVRFVLVNAQGQLDRILGVDGERPLCDALKSSGIEPSDLVSVSGQLRAVNNLDGAVALFLECADAQTAGALADALRQAAAGAPPDGGIRDIDIGFEHDTVVRVEGVVLNLPDKVMDAIREAQAKEEPADLEPAADLPTPPSP